MELKLVEQWSSAAENAQLMQVGVISHSETEFLADHLYVRVT